MTLNDFSCVIVTYNRLNTLSFLLNDINNQTILPAELFIVNNGSAIFLDLFKFKYKITVIDNKLNSLTIGRNLGLKYVRTPFVFFLDDDIRLVPKNYFYGMLSDFNSKESCFGLQAYIKQEKPLIFRTLILRFFFLYSLEDSCIVKPSVNVTYPHSFKDSSILRCEWISGTNQLYRSSDLKKFSWDEKLFKYCDGEDLDFSYNLHVNHKELYLTFNYEIIHSESTLSRLDSEELIFMREVYGYYLFSKYFGTNLHKLMFSWSRVGKLFIAIFSLFRNFDLQSIKCLFYLIKAFAFVFSNRRDIKIGNLTRFNNKFNYDIQNL
jgi:GT2 family glycosyltransferase